VGHFFGQQIYYHTAKEQRDGVWAVWNKDGSLIEENLYDKGDFQSKKVY